MASYHKAKKPQSRNSSEVFLNPYSLFSLRPSLSGSRSLFHLKLIFLFSLPQPSRGDDQPFVIVADTGDQQKDLVLFVDIRQRVMPFSLSLT